MKISAIVCTYNREQYILDVLTSLSDQTLESSLYEILLVDNNSTDATPLLCMDFAQYKGDVQFHYYKETKQGLSYARNTGIENAQGEYVVFIDDDAVAAKEYLAEIVSFFDTHQLVGAIGGRIFPKYEAPLPHWMPYYLTPLFSILDLGERNKPFSAGKYPVGANMAFRKSVFADCGMFNTDLGRTGKNMMGGEEKDVFYRIQKLHIQVWYVAKAWVYHIIPQQRMTKEFIRAQACGVGVSERFRTKSSSWQFAGSIVKECAKWGVSLFISLFYLFLLQASKAGMMLRFRWWVTKGLLVGNLS